MSKACVPERIADDEKGDVDLVGFVKDIVAGRFDHFTVGYDDLAAIKGFLLPCQLAQSSFPCCAKPHQRLLVDEQDGRVGLEIDALRLFHDF